MTSLKLQLYNLCLAYVNRRIDTAQSAITTSREAANNDTKSSAGDKYETGRAMMQQDIDHNTLQLQEAIKLQLVLEKLNPEQNSSIVQAGSLVFTNHGNFYIAVSAGTLSIEELSYYAISFLSPIGTCLMGLKEGASFVFNGKTFKVEKIL